MAKEDSTDKLINLQAQQLAAQVANWAAQLDFAKERFRLLELPEFQTKSQLEIDRLAFDKAQATWENAYKEASLTGTYQGQPTMEWLTQQAQLTGVLNGQQTLQGKLTDAQIAQMNEQMRLANQQFLVQTTGYMDGRPTFEREQWQTGQTGYIGDQATMARQQMEANLSGYFGGRQTLERERFGAEQTQNYLQLLSSLQGPGNAFKQMRVLGATDQNLQNLVSGWAGTYNMPGFGSSGAPGQAQISDLYLGSAQPGSQPGAPNTGPPGMPYQWAPGYGPGGYGVPGGGGAPGAAPPPPPGVGQAGGAPLPAAAMMATPDYTGPQGIVPPVPGEPVPGAGIPPAQWDAATLAAADAWNAAHPGFEIDGSQQGYHAMTPGQLAINPYTGLPYPWDAQGPRYGQQGYGTAPPMGLVNGGYGYHAPVPDLTNPDLAETPIPRYWPQSGVWADYDPNNPNNWSGLVANAPLFDQNWAGYNEWIDSQAAWNPGTSQQQWSATPVHQTTGTTSDPGYEIFANYTMQYHPDITPAGLAQQWASMTPVVRSQWTGSGAPGSGAVVPPVAPPQVGGGTSALPPAPGTPEYDAAMAAATNNLDVPGYTYSPPGTTAPPGAYNYSTTEQGHTQTYPPGVTAPPQQEQVSTQTPVSNATANSLLANPMPGMGGSLSPSQINAENYGKMNPYAQEFMWGWFENQGWDTQAAKGEFMKSLPKYNGPAQGHVQI